MMMGFRMRLLSGLASVAILASGCATTSVRKAVESGNPLPQWEKDLVAYYTAVEGGDAASGEPGRLKFIVDYERKYAQLSGINQAYFLTGDTATTVTPGPKHDTAFSDLSYNDYAAYRRDKLVAELQAQQELIKAGEETLRLATLEARLALKEAERKVLEGDGKKNTKAYKDLEKEISGIKDDILAAAEKSNEAKLAAIQVDIDRITQLGVTQDTEKHLLAAGLLELAKLERNEILGDLMTIAKRVHDMKDNYLHYTRASANTLFDFTQIIASGIGSVAGSESTARALSALATGSAAAQESFDARFFYQHATTAVISVMKAQRLKAEQVLVSNMTKDVIEYPLRVALAEYADFLLAGGLTDALAELGTDAKNKELRELEKLEELKTMSTKRLEELKEQEAARQAEAAARKARQKAYVDLVDQALFGRIDAILNPPSSEGEDGDD